MHHIGEIPCARNSLLSGIASGVGVGVIRGLSVRTSTPNTVSPCILLHLLIRRVRSVIGEPLGCGDVHARLTRDLVSRFHHQSFASLVLDSSQA